nr:MAG TPA: TRX family protein [Caudoviricetes sp.]
MFITRPNGAGRANWCRPCRTYWPKVLVRAVKLDVSDELIDGVQSVPTMDVIVDGELRLRATQWGPGTRRQVLEVLS